MKLIKKITVDYDNIDIEYAKRIENAIDYFSELCVDNEIKCEKTCPLYSLCAKNSDDILSMFSKYAESHVE